MGNDSNTISQMMTLLRFPIHPIDSMYFLTNAIVATRALQLVLSLSFLLYDFGVVPYIQGSASKLRQTLTDCLSLRHACICYF